MIQFVSFLDSRRMPSDRRRANSGRGPRNGTARPAAIATARAKAKVNKKKRRPLGRLSENERSYPFGSPSGNRQNAALKKPEFRAVLFRHFRPPFRKRSRTAARTVMGRHHVQISRTVAVGCGDRTWGDPVERHRRQVLPLARRSRSPTDAAGNQSLHFTVAASRRATKRLSRPPGTVGAIMMTTGRHSWQRCT